MAAAMEVSKSGGRGGWRRGTTMVAGTPTGPSPCLSHSSSAQLSGLCVSAVHWAQWICSKPIVHFSRASLVCPSDSPRCSPTLSPALRMPTALASLTASLHSQRAAVHLRRRALRRLRWSSSLRLRPCRLLLLSRDVVHRCAGLHRRCHHSRHQQRKEQRAEGGGRPTGRGHLTPPHSAPSTMDSRRPALPRTDERPSQLRGDGR